jgi:hypothetical protein
VGRIRAIAHLAPMLLRPKPSMAPPVRPPQTWPTVTERRVTLWTAGAGASIACVAEAHPLGLELQYLLDGRPVMRRVFDSWDRLTGQAQRWRERLTGDASA